VQLGTWNVFGGAGSCPLVPQQMRALLTVQSSSDLHDFGQVAWQTPPQQRGVELEPLQSLSLVQVLGQAVAWRQIDLLPMLGSSPPALAQQISPDVVSQSVLDVQVVGQLLAAVQIGVE
jgi:hypothetical protein